MKAIDIDYQEIKEACRRFKIAIDEPWLRFTEQALWMHWVTKPKDFIDVTNGNHECIDVCIDENENWIAAEDLEPNEILRFEQRMVYLHVRYILNTF